MTLVATQRLIDASAQLGAGDRALLNLLVHHGIDDAALGRLLRLSEPEAEARRELLARRLSEQLGLPPEDVHRALGELMLGAREPTAASEPGPLAAAPSRAAPTATIRGRGVRRTASRGRWIRVGAAALGAAAVLVALIALSTGTGSAPPNAARADARPQVKRELALAALPGSPSAARGRLVLTGGVRPRLTVSVAGLAPARGGHYELWLYNSIIDARPLASLGTTGETVIVVLPPGYRRYRWLDVSRQTGAMPYDSGRSVLRVALPV